MIELIIIFELLTCFDDICFMETSKQVYDTSCGFSSIATVMGHWYGDDVKESDLIEETFSDSENETYIISMDRLSKILLNHGYFTKGYRMTFEELSDAIKKYPPILVHYNINSGHFALLLGIEKNNVIISDPFDGLKSMNKKEFLKIWSQNVLLIGHKNKIINKTKLENIIGEVQAQQNFLEFVGQL